MGSTSINNCTQLGMTVVLNWQFFCESKFMLCHVFLLELSYIYNLAYDSYSLSQEGQISFRVCRLKGHVTIKTWTITIMEQNYPNVLYVSLANYDRLIISHLFFSTFNFWANIIKQIFFVSCCSHLLPVWGHMPRYSLFYISIYFVTCLHDFWIVLLV